MKKLILVTIAFVILAIGCGGPTASYRVVKLRSGKEVKVLSIMKMHFSKGEPALMLKYQTDLSLSDVASLRKEVQEIWSDFFEAEVEKASLKNAIISAVETPKGMFIKKTSGYNFVFEKASTGIWSIHK